MARKGRAKKEETQPLVLGNRGYVSIMLSQSKYSESAGLKPKKLL